MTFSQIQNVHNLLIKKKLTLFGFMLSMYVIKVHSGIWECSYINFSLYE